MLSKSTPVIFVERPDSEREAILQTEYGTAENSKLVESTKKLEKRFGAERTREVVNLIEKGIFEYYIFCFFFLSLHSLSFDFISYLLLIFFFFVNR